MWRHPKLIRFVLWTILAGILGAWLAASLQNPRRASKVYSVAFSPDGALLALGTDDESVVLFEPAGGKRLTTLVPDGFGHSIRFAIFSPDGKTLVAGGSDEELTAWDVESRHTVRSFETQFGNHINCAAFSPDGNSIAIGGEDDTIRIWNWKESPSAREIITSHTQRINTIAYSPDGAVLATGSSDETIKLTDAASGKEIATLGWDDQSDVNTNVESVAFSPAGDTLLAGMEHGTLVVWDARSHAQREVLHPHSAAVNCVTYATDGSRYATGSWDGTALLFDAETNAILKKIVVGRDWVWSVAISPDGKTLAAGADGGTARLQDLSSDRFQTLIAEPATAPWWILGLAAWGGVFAWVRWKTAPEVTAPARPDVEPTSVESTSAEPSVEVPPHGEAADQSDPLVPSAILVAGALLYFALCGPAIGQRGYPPIDPAWTAMTFLWVSPILLSEAIAGGYLRRHLKVLAIYSFVTGFVDAESVVMMVPKHVDFLGSLVMTLLGYGPGHLLIGWLLVWFMQVVRWTVHGLMPHLSQSATNSLRWSAAAGILVLTVAFPFAFRELTFFAAGARGRSQAETDWNERRARLISERNYDRGTVQHEFDPETGLKLDDRHWHDPHFTRANAARVRELLRERGIPDWSMKRHLVPDAELLALLDSDELEEVTSFPHDVNENVVLFRRGTISRWGGSMSSGDDGLSIASKESGMSGFGGKVEPAYVGRSTRDPAVFFIRSGSHFIAAYHESGQLLSSVWRE